MAYLTPDQIRERVSSLADPAKYPDVGLSDLVAEFEEIAERYRGVAFEPREATELRYFECGASVVQLVHRPVREISSIEIEAVESTDYTLDAQRGRVYLTVPRGATVGFEYEHGLDEPPPTLLRACRLYVRACAKADDSSLPRDVIAQSADGLLTRFSSPDWKAKRPTGYIDIDRLLNSLRDYRIGVA